MLGKGSLRYKNWENHARELQNMPKDCKVINTGSTPSLKSFDYRLWNVQGYNLGFQPQPLYYDFETLKKYSHNISKGAKICIGIEEFKFLVDAYDDKSTDYKYYLWLDKDQIRTYDKKIGWLMKHAPAILHPEFALGDIKWIIKRVLRKKPVDFTSINTEIDDIQKFCSNTDLRYQFPYRRSRTFCSHDVHIIVSCHGKNSKDKYKNAHASDPVGKTPPDQAGF